MDCVVWNTWSRIVSKHVKEPGTLGAIAIPSPTNCRQRYLVAEASAVSWLG